MRMMDALMTALERNLIGFTYVLFPIANYLIVNSCPVSDYGTITQITTIPTATSGMEKTSRGSVDHAPPHLYPPVSSQRNSTSRLKS